VKGLKSTKEHVDWYAYMYTSIVTIKMNVLALVLLDSCPWSWCWEVRMTG